MKANLKLGNICQKYLIIEALSYSPQIHALNMLYSTSRSFRSMLIKTYPQFVNICEHWNKLPGQKLILCEDETANKQSIKELNSTSKLNITTFDYYQTACSFQNLLNSQMTLKKLNDYHVNKIIIKDFRCPFPSNLEHLSNYMNKFKVSKVQLDLKGRAKVFRRRTVNEKLKVGQLKSVRTLETSFNNYMDQHVDWQNLKDSKNIRKVKITNYEFLLKAFKFIPDNLSTLSLKWFCSKNYPMKDMNFFTLAQMIRSKRIKRVQLGKKMHSKFLFRLLQELQGSQYPLMIVQKELVISDVSAIFDLEKYRKTRDIKYKTVKLDLGEIYSYDYKPLFKFLYQHSEVKLLLQRIEVLEAPDVNFFKWMIKHNYQSQIKKIEIERMAKHRFGPFNELNFVQLVIFNSPRLEEIKNGYFPETLKFSNGYKFPLQVISQKSLTLKRFELGTLAPQLIELFEHFQKIAIENLIIKKQRNFKHMKEFFDLIQPLSIKKLTLYTPNLKQQIDEDADREEKTLTPEESELITAQEFICESLFKLKNLQYLQITSAFDFKIYDSIPETQGDQFPDLKTLEVNMIQKNEYPLDNFHKLAKKLPANEFVLNFHDRTLIETQLDQDNRMILTRTLQDRDYTR